MWLDDAEIRHRQIRQDLAGREHPDRDAQFKRIQEVSSIDKRQVLFYQKLSRATSKSSEVYRLPMDSFIEL